MSRQRSVTQPNAKGEIAALSAPVFGNVPRAFRS
jgi:hypothetical protein